MNKPLIIKTTHNINIAKFATFIIGVNFVLGRFYEMTYLYVIGVDTRKIEANLLDYIRTGLDLLPITILIIFYSLFSIKPDEASKIFKNKYVSIQRLHSSWIIRKICDYWIPEFIIFGIFLVYSFSIFDSVLFLILLFMTPFLIYIIYKKKIEQIIKARISYAHSLTIKFVLVLISVFTVIGMIDGNADKVLSKKRVHIVSLRTPNNLTIKKKTLNDDIYFFKGYTLRAFDKITIFSVDGKLVVINNWEIIAIKK